MPFTNNSCEPKCSPAANYHSNISIIITDGPFADNRRRRSKQTSPSVGIDCLFNVTEGESQPPFAARRNICPPADTQSKKQVRNKAAELQEIRANSRNYAN